jgi:phosphate transport system permease protein
MPTTLERSHDGPNPAADAGPTPPPRGASRRLRTRRRRDSQAKIVVVSGGVLIIAGVLGILFFLVVEVVPLLAPAEVVAHAPVAGPASAPLGVLTDDSRSFVALLGSDGVVRVVRGDDGSLVAEKALAKPPARPAGGATLGNAGFVLGDDHGSVVTVAIAFETAYRDDRAVVSAKIGDPVTIAIDAGGAPVVRCAASLHGFSAAVVATRADGRVVVALSSVEENPFSGEKTTQVSRHELDSPAAVDAVLIDRRREDVYAATADGRLLWWSLGSGEPGPQVYSVGAPVTALSLLLGDQALVLGQADGALSIWFRVARSGERPRLARVRDFPRLGGAVRLIAPSARDRTFWAQDDAGHAALCYSTSERVLWSGDSPEKAASAVALSPKMNGAIVAAAGSFAALEIDSRHPEASFSAYFRPVWYEGYDGPEHVWQSSSGSDEAEPKFGLMPLVFGTLKATLFSLLFAVPLALLAAMYTSQFMHWKLKRVVKPVVEIMASLPSVVLGFLAGLWLAPRVAIYFLALPLALVVVPVAILAASAIGQRLPAALRHRFPDGFESVASIGVIALAIGVCVLACHPLEAAWFGGDFVAWLRSALGVAYDSKNCVVLGLAMGVAVIPIIFAIAEESFSNVPRTLVSGSLALGADRWYTVTRVVLPTASAGLFSAVMIGFGRAIGETMIVVMASGNTPIMDWSMLRGLRSLSANIATEIPEAPDGGTLYRTLFLAALLLFALTFVVNTAAELVRQHLRQRYARL